MDSDTLDCSISQSPKDLIKTHLVGEAVKYFFSRESGGKYWLPSTTTVSFESAMVVPLYVTLVIVLRDGGQEGSVRPSTYISQHRSGLRVIGGVHIEKWS